MKKDIVDINNIPTKRLIFDRAEETVIIQQALLVFFKQVKKYHEDDKKLNIDSGDYWLDKMEEVKFMLEQIKA